MRAVLVVALLGTAIAPVDAARAQATPAVTDEESAPRVAIVVEIAVGVAPERATEIAGALAAALSTKLIVDARGGTTVVERLPPEGLPDGCLARPACVTDVASRLEVDELLFIALLQLGDRLQIDASWMDATGTRSVTRPRILLGPDDVPDEVFRGRAVTLLPEARLRRAATAIPTPPPPRRGHHMTAGTWTFTAIAAAGLGAGIGLGLSTRSTFHACERDGCDASERDALRTRGHLADASFGVAALAAIAGTILYLRSTPAAPQVQVDVAADGESAALVVGGRF